MGRTAGARLGTRRRRAGLRATPVRGGRVQGSFCALESRAPCAYVGLDCRKGITLGGAWASAWLAIKSASVCSRRDTSPRSHFLSVLESSASYFRGRDSARDLCHTEAAQLERPGHAPFPSSCPPPLSEGASQRQVTSPSRRNKDVSRPRTHHRQGREGESENESPPEGANFGVPFAFWLSEGAGRRMHLLQRVDRGGQLLDSRAQLLDLLRAPCLQDTCGPLDRPQPPTSAE